MAEEGFVIRSDMTHRSAQWPSRAAFSRVGTSLDTAISTARKLSSCNLLSNRLIIVGPGASQKDGNHNHRGPADEHGLHAGRASL